MRSAVEPSPFSHKGRDSLFTIAYREGIVVVGPCAKWRWPDCDAESGMHCVLYDDGEEYWEELGGALAPRYCLEGWHEE